MPNGVVRLMIAHPSATASPNIVGWATQDATAAGGPIYLEPWPQPVQTISSSSAAAVSLEPAHRLPEIGVWVLADGTPLQPPPAPPEPISEGSNAAQASPEVAAANQPNNDDRAAAKVSPKVPPPPSVPKLASRLAGQTSRPCCRDQLNS